MAKKKRSSTTPSEIPENKQEEPVPEQKKKSPVPKKAGNEIEEIFAGMKRKKPDPNATEKPNGEENSKPKPSKKKRNTKSKENRDERFSESSSRPRRKTADGFTIYTEEELCIGKSDAGNTPLCPFDCDCCF